MIAEHKKIFIVQSLILGLILFMPLGATVKSIFTICTIVAILLTHTYRKNLLYAINTPWGAAAVILFLFILIACLWSPAPYSMQWSTLSKYLKLVYLPILAIAFVHPKLRQWSIQAYIATMLVCCIITIVRARGMIGIIDPGALAYNHNIVGFMIVLACYFAGLCLFKAVGWMREFYFSIVLLMTYQTFFINQGRVVYLIYFALFALLLAQKLNIKRAAIGVLLAGAMLGVFYTQSAVMHQRVYDLWADLQYWKSQQYDTSMGYRIQFHKYSWLLFKEHPVKGNGTGGFRQRFVQDNPVPSWGTGSADPHSQYWMILSDFGLIGFGLFILFLTSLYVTAFKLQETKPILLGVLIPFTILCATDTVLSFSPVGMLLIIFSALALGELIQKRQLPAV